MKVFVISIEDDNSPRLTKFLDQSFFSKSQIEFKKFGIKGGALSAKQYFEQAVRGRTKPLSPSELGCTLSHLSALNSFLETTDEYALIFEDDAIIPENMSLDKLESEIKKIEWTENTLLSLGGIQMKECLKIRGKIKDYKLLGQKILEVVPDFYHRVNYAVAYIVDREMAKNLIEYHQPIRKADDWSYLFDFNNKSNILMTYLVEHPEIEAGETNLQLSAIEAERINSKDIPRSKYGHGLRKNLAKISSKKYFE